MKISNLDKIKLSIFYLTICIFLIFCEETFGGVLKEEQYLDSLPCSTNNPISLNPNKTLIIKLSRWGPYHRGLSFLNFKCSFRVEAPKGYGIMAVFQNLHLRTKNHQSTSCRDYVKFEQSDGLEAGPICGEISEGDLAENIPTLIGPRFFYDPKGLLEVSFKFDDNHLDDIQKPFRVELALTAYAECTSTGVIQRQLRHCSKSKMHSCISPNLFCDGVINCGYRGADFGSDETGCGPSSSTALKQSKKDDELKTEPLSPRVGKNKKNEQVEEGEENDKIGQIHLGVPVQVFALVSAFCGGLVVLLVFFICCSIFKNIKKRRGNTGNHNGRAFPVRRVQQTNVQMSELSNAIEVPSGVIKVASPDDLPPSYEAIFPEPVPQKR